jgi:hypothetical protein
MFSGKPVSQDGPSPNESAAGPKGDVSPLLGGVIGDDKRAENDGGGVWKLACAVGSLASSARGTGGICDGAPGLRFRFVGVDMMDDSDVVFVPIDVLDMEVKSNRGSETIDELEA